MKKRQILAIIAGGCLALLSFIPLIEAGARSQAYQYAYVWWIAVFGVAVATAIIVAAFWKD